MSNEITGLIPEHQVNRGSTPAYAVQDIPLDIEDDIEYEDEETGQIISIPGNKIPLIRQGQQVMILGMSSIGMDPVSGKMIELEYPVCLVYIPFSGDPAVVKPKAIRADRLMIERFVGPTGAVYHNILASELAKALISDEDNRLVMSLPDDEIKSSAIIQKVHRSRTDGNKA